MTDTARRPALAALLACLALIPGTLPAQSAFPFKAPFGPYTPGFAAATLDDSTRTFGVPPTDAAAVSVGPAVRRLQVSTWYPGAGQGGSAMRYRDYAGLFVAPNHVPSGAAADADVATRAFVATMGPSVNLADPRVQRELDAPVRARRGAPHASGRFPVIVYAPSFNQPGFENDVLFEYLASVGYVVLASPSFGAAGGMTADLAGLEAQAADIEALMAYARTLAFADPSRMAVMGASWGGMANVLAAARHPAIGAVICLEGSIGYFYGPLLSTVPSFDVTAYRTPSLFFSQVRDAVSPGEDSTFAFFDALGPVPAYDITIPVLRHMNYGAQFNRLFPRAARPFNADRAAVGPAYELMAGYVRTFLDAYLRQNPAAHAAIAQWPAVHGQPGDGVIIRRKGM